MGGHMICPAERLEVESSDLLIDVTPFGMEKLPASISSVYGTLMGMGDANTLATGLIATWTIGHPSMASR